MIFFILRRFKSFGKSLATLAVCSVLLSTADLLSPYLIGKFIDEILLTRDTKIFYQFIVALTIISVVAIFANWLNFILTAKIQAKATNTLLEEMIGRIYRLRGDFVFKTDMVYLSKRLDRDIHDLINFAISNLAEIFINFSLG